MLAKIHLAILYLCFSFTCLAADLPLNVLLDDKGQPLAIPTEQQIALDYTPVPHTTASYSAQTPRTNKKARAKQKATKMSRKQQLKNRNSIADNSNCRWLSARMTQLEKQLNPGINHRNRHQQQELNARQTEWECLKCGAEGPEPRDYYACQYRR